MMHVILWKWRQANFRHDYTSEHANIVADMVLRHSHDLKLRIVCVTDDATGLDMTKIVPYPLWSDHGTLPNRSGVNLPSCYRRLKIFDAETQEAMGIKPGDRVISLDLDSIVANDVRPLWTKHQHFIGWAVRGQHHLRVFNGSMWMFNAGEHQHMWTNFDPKRTPDRVHKAGFLGSDQSWLSYNFARDATAGTWAYPQAVSYPKEVKRRPMLSKGTSLVFFHGRHKPWHEDVQKESPWVKEHWRLGGVEAGSAPGTVRIIAQGAQAQVA